MDRFRKNNKSIKQLKTFKQKRKRYDYARINNIGVAKMESCHLYKTWGLLLLP